MNKFKSIVQRNIPTVTITRERVVAEGGLVDVTAMARQLGIVAPVYITAAVWSEYVEVSPRWIVECEEERLWDILVHVEFSTDCAPYESTEIQLNSRKRSNGKRTFVTLDVGVDEDGVITIMVPGED